MRTAKGGAGVTRRPSISIRIEDLNWDRYGPDDDPSAWLSTELTIGSALLRVDAIAVKPGQENDPRCQVAAHPDLDTMFDKYAEADEIDGAYQTTRIGKRDYAVFAFPHGA